VGSPFILLAFLIFYREKPNRTMEQHLNLGRNYEFFSE
jgi:hypothetical protein